MSDWGPAVVTGALATTTAVFLAIWNRRTQKAAAVQGAEIESSLAQDAALRSYEFDARKRLYTEVNPLVFQLRELSRGSRNRARRIISGEMTVGPDHVTTSVQRLCAPLVVAQEIQRHLTVVDLRLDANLSAQYAVARELLWTLHSGIAMAGMSPAIEYLSAQDRPSPQQHLTHAKLLRLVDALTVRDAEGPCRPMKQTELDNLDKAQEPQLEEALRPFRRLFKGATPATAPVLWRLLLAHAMFLHVFADLVDRNDSVVGEVMPPDIDAFSWGRTDPGLDPSIFNAERDAAACFVRKRLEDAGLAIADPGPTAQRLPSAATAERPPQSPAPPERQ
jgi:hypothetical protein